MELRRSNGRATEPWFADPPGTTLRLVGGGFIRLATRFESSTAARINETRDHGGRVIAIGTTVVRALESVVDARRVVHAGEGWTDVVVTPERGAHAVDGLLTGWHEPEASHLQMLEAIAGRDLLDVSYAAASAEGYLWHEFGDVHLIVP